MGAPSVRVEVLPVANKPRYEKSLIGHLFTGDIKDSSSKANSPLLVRSKAESQPEPRQETKVSTRLEGSHPGDPRVRTPEPAVANLPPAELQSGSLERRSPTTSLHAESSSPTPSSPLPWRTPAQPGPGTLTKKKGGKRLKIDLKKGKYTAGI